MKIWKKFIPCSCGGEGIMVSYEQEEDGLPVINLAFFEEGFTSSHKLSFMGKLRYIFNILLNGEPYYDMVILNKENAKELMEELQGFLNTNKTVWHSPLQ